VLPLIIRVRLRFKGRVRVGVRVYHSHLPQGISKSEPQ